MAGGSLPVFGGSMGGSSMSNEGRLTAERARALALEAGFQEAGLVALPYESEARDAARFREWVAAGRAGTMGYLERRSEDGQLLRERAGIPFPWARSALICFASYAFPSAPLSTKGSEPRSGWIARYAWTSRVLPSRLLPSGGDAKGERRPSDYHKVLLKRMRAVEARLHQQLGEFDGTDCRARARDRGWTWLDGEEYLPDSSGAGVVWISGGAVDVPRGHSKGQNTGGGRPGSGSLRQLHTLHRGLSDECAHRSLSDGCFALHLVSDHRA
jgi:hypothetical protein